jgi:cell volume regulation protein A
MDATTLFFIGSMAIFLGFVSDYLFRRFKAPDVLILIVFGIALGPGLTGVISDSLAEKITSLTPYVAALALAIIMFQAGMGLKLKEVVIHFSKALLQTFLGFTLSVFLTAVVCMTAMGWDLMYSLLLGAILGGTSGAIVVPLIRGLALNGSVKTVLTLEAAITDGLAIAVAMTIIGYLGSTEANLGGAIGGIFSAFLISGLMGLVAGYVWLRILSKYFGSQPFSYMVTLATLMGVYALTEVVVGGMGGGVIASLAFGLTLANGDDLAHVLKHDAQSYKCDENICKLHDEISFFVRTFFFIYLGLMITTIEVSLVSILFGVTVFMALVLARLFATRIMGNYISPAHADRTAMFFMMPRGLSSAVLASIPLTMGVVGTAVGETILATVTIIILLTTVLASIGAFRVDTLCKEGRVRSTHATNETDNFRDGW